MVQVSKILTECFENNQEMQEKAHIFWDHFSKNVWDLQVASDDNENKDTNFMKDLLRNDQMQNTLLLTRSLVN